MKKCKYADKYKAVFYPRCNKGNPCDTCKRKWADRNQGKKNGNR